MHEIFLMTVAFVAGGVTSVAVPKLGRWFGRQYGGARKRL